MPKILAVCTTQLIALSSTVLDQKSRSRQHECRTKVRNKVIGRKHLAQINARLDAA